MGSLLYSMITSLDGYAEAADGDLGGGADDEELHRFVDETFRSVGTYLYGRRMYETMVFWETAADDPSHPAYVREYARAWQAAEKVVYSTTLPDVSSANTRIERRFDADEVRRLKDRTAHDLTVDGPTLAAQAIRAGLVDEYHLFTTTTVVGGGTRFFPDGVRLDLERVGQHLFDGGMTYTRYRARAGRSED